MTIAGLFLLTSLTLYAQQAGAGCSGQRPIRQQAASAVCKPTLPDSQRPSNYLPRHDDGVTYVTFDVAGAANGTFTSAINDWALVTGYYVDGGGNYHGFLRDWFGTITSFDVPGDGGGTVSSAINNAGTVTGNWCPDTTYTHCPGFLRDLWGNITSFEPPGEYYTNPEAISPNGSVTGDYFDASGVGHGFVRTPGGSITEFDPPGSIWTWPWAIGADGTIAGSYQDANGGWHGFLRNRNGNITSFDVPGYGNTGEGAFYGGRAVSMNPEGDIAGSYVQTTNTYDGFLRHRDGTFDTFYAADYAPCCIWTFPTAINAGRTIAGYLNDGYDINRGFVRTRDGNVTLFDAPGAGTGEFQGTVVVGMTESRVIAGFYIDSNGLNHGFLRIPH